MCSSNRLLRRMPRASRVRAEQVGLDRQLAAHGEAPRPSGGWSAASETGDVPLTRLDWLDARVLQGAAVRITLVACGRLVLAALDASCLARLPFARTPMAYSMITSRLSVARPGMADGRPFHP
jgi:hypothetical protein